MYNTIICEDDTLVWCNEEGDNVEWYEQKPTILSVRIELDNGDAEFVDIKQLADLYRKHVLKMAVGKVVSPYTDHIIALYRSSDLPYKKRRYAWLCKETGIHETDISAYINRHRNMGEKRYEKLKNALMKYHKEQLNKEATK